METYSNHVNALAPPQLDFEETELITDFNYIGYSQDIDGDGIVTLESEIHQYPQLGLCTTPSLSILPYMAMFPNRRSNT